MEMKTKIVFCFFVIAVFFTGQSLANQSAEFEPEYPALTFLQEEGQWEKFIAAAKNNKAVVSCQKVDGSNTECLKPEYVARGAFNFASKNPQLMNLVAENQRGETAYMDLFMAYNNFPKGGGLPLEQFHKLATGQISGTGILYPVNSEYLKSLKGVKVAQASQPVQTDASPAISTFRPAVKPEVVKPSEAEVQISNLQKQIAEMKKALVGNVKAKEDLIALEKRFNLLVGELDRLGGNQTALAQHQKRIATSVADISESLIVLEGRYKDEISSTKSEIYADIEAIADAVEHNQMIIVIIVISLSVVIVLLSLYFWFTNRGTRKIANEAKGIAEGADGKAGLATSKLKKLETDVGLLSEVVDEIQAVDPNDCPDLKIHNEQGISKEYTSSLCNGEMITVIVNFSGKDWRINFVRVSDTHFHVFGIKRTKSAKSNEMDVNYMTSFPDFIRKAYNDKRIFAEEVKLPVAA